MRHPVSLLLVCGFALAGCAPTFRTTTGRVPEVRERWTPSYVFGMFGDPALDVRDICSSGAASAVSVGSNFGTVAVSVVTLGIYTPRKVWIACAPKTH